jgi:hypothetical protein
MECRKHVKFGTRREGKALVTFSEQKEALSVLMLLSGKFSALENKDSGLRIAKVGTYS